MKQWLLQKYRKQNTIKKDFLQSQHSQEKFLTAQTKNEMLFNQLLASLKKLFDLFLLTRKSRNGCLIFVLKHSKYFTACLFQNGDQTSINLNLTKLPTSQNLTQKKARTGKMFLQIFVEHLSDLAFLKQNEHFSQVQEVNMTVKWYTIISKKNGQNLALFLKTWTLHCINIPNLSKNIS